MNTLASPARLEALAATGLRAEADEALDRFAELVAELLEVPIALVSLVDDRRQFLPGLIGLGAPWSDDREMPLSHSFCQHVVTSAEPLVVGDAHNTPLVCDSLAIPDLGVVGYAGMPLFDRDGNVLGSLCAIDTDPRDWTHAELRRLRRLAQMCSAELQLRIATAEARLAKDDAERVSDRAQALGTRLGLIFEVTRAMSSTLDIDEALRRLTRIVVPNLADGCVAHRVSETLSVDRVSVTHRDASIGTSGLEGPLPPIAVGSTGPLARVLLGGAELLTITLDDLQGHTDPLTGAQTQLLTALRCRQALVVGLRGRDGVLGSFTLVRSDDYRFTDADVSLARELADRAALAVDNARLYSQQRTAAETLQAALLTQLPQVEGVQLAARYRPASAGVDVGGDWYDAFLLPDGALALVIGDVVGHDLAAASKMGQLRNVLRGIAYDREDPPNEILRRLDQAMNGLELAGLATCLLARVDQDHGGYTLRWSNAGHLPPVLLRADGHTRVLESGVEDLLLGLDDAFPRHDSVAVIEPGDTLLLFTDGLVERRDASLETGLARLRRDAGRHAHLAPGALCDQLLSDLVRDTDNDDVALLAVRITKPDEPA